MQLSPEQFHQNLLATLIEIAEEKSAVQDCKFIITPVKEPDAKYNSTDDFMRLTLLTDENVKGKFYEINDVVTLLSGPNSSYPLWIDVVPAESSASACVFELKISMRFRKPSELRYKETGHPPFKSVK
ncbi:MAG TPA: hypothetical protein VF629_11490 [Hymenobacter sp.]|jgi:hypothetical protein|uniref:hypothetical protein n=1 Tax=Hymenobacter sp. TaxID=1898978 RepID=UPI002ED87039